MNAKLNTILSINSTIEHTNSKYNISLSLPQYFVLLSIYSNPNNIYEELERLNIYTHRQSINNRLDELKTVGLVDRSKIGANSLTILGRIVVSSFLSSLE